MIQVLEALNHMKVGRSVAEMDDDLDQYFIETETFRALIEGEKDIIAGDKGTGKSAIYRMLQQNYRNYDALNSVHVVSAFNPTGNPIFQRLAKETEYSEAAYQTLWKAFFLSLVGNWIVGVYGAEYNDELSELDALLSNLGLKSRKAEVATVFSNLLGVFKNLSNPKKAYVDFSVTETGMPTVSPGVEFGGDEAEIEVIYSDDFLMVLERALEACDTTVWLAMDRLDEAFVGSPEIEKTALRALLRSYLDMGNLKRLKLKLFLRRDLFRRVTSGGFVNLSHVNAMRVDIEWNDQDLVSMLARRLLFNKEFSAAIGVEIEKPESLFPILFPEQIDVGERKPSSLNWIMSRIKDGKGVRPPRNLIDLAIKARENQLRREQRAPRGNIEMAGPLLEGDAVRDAHKQLSSIRVDDTLLAEAGTLAEIIELFKDGQSEHNLATLGEVLNGTEDSRSIIRALVEMGFLEEVADNFKIPMLYRYGLNITQGKAF